MKVSIIIPSFGQSQYLDTAILSALQQSYKDIEIIVIDDGSTDGSLKIAQKYKDDIKVVQQSNKGLASARNAGIMNATGDYILPLDADDFLVEDAVEKLVAVALETNADVVAPSIRCFGSVMTQDVILMKDPKFDDFKEGNRLAYCALIKREALLETGGYSPRMDVLGGWEDLHLWYDFMRRGKKITTIQEPLVFYRTKPESMWTKAEKNKKALWEQIHKDFPETVAHKKV